MNKSLKNIREVQNATDERLGEVHLHVGRTTRNNQSDGASNKTHRWRKSMIPKPIYRWTRTKEIRKEIEKMFKPEIF